MPSKTLRSLGAVAFRVSLGIVCLLSTHAGATELWRTGTLLEGIPCLSDSAQTYSLYLPTSYSPERTWPALLIFDPRGRSVLAAERFRQAAESFGWILVSADGTRSDGPWEPNRRVTEALWPEVHGRYAVDPQRVYAAGFSGGAIVAWYLAQFGTPSLAGVIACGGRMAAEIPLDSVHFPHFGAAGSADFNFIEMKALDRAVARHGAAHQFRVFPGRHQWMPTELARESVEWMEILAMQRQLRPVDAGLVERAYVKAMAAAEALVASKEKLEALSRYGTIVETWSGLRDVSDAHRRLRSLQEDPETHAREQSIRQAERFETDRLQRLAGILGDESSFGSFSDETLRQTLRIPALQELAADESAQGGAARRVLEWIFTRASFYLAQERLQRGETVEARLLLHVALHIHPQAGWVWYDLARTEAREGDITAALQALKRALDHGFADAPRLLADPDLEPLRPYAAYDSLLLHLPSSQHPAASRAPADSSGP